MTMLSEIKKGYSIRWTQEMMEWYSNRYGIDLPIVQTVYGEFAEVTSIKTSEAYGEVLIYIKGQPVANWNFDICDIDKLDFEVEEL